MLSLESKNTSADEDRSQKYLGWVAGSLILFPLIARVAQYLHYRALFHDEAVLASKVVDRTFFDLLMPYGDSMAPGGYMAATKIAILIGGMNEFAARFVPFIGGAILVLIFYPVARRLTSTQGALIALAFLAVSKYLVEYSDFVRPYSTDALTCIALLGVAVHIDNRPPSWSKSLIFGGAGAVAVWLSYPAVFVLAGIGTMQILSPIAERKTERIPHALLSSGMWITSFLIFYLLSIRSIRSDGETMNMMNDYYQFANAFMPLPPTSFQDLKWFNYHAIKTFTHPGGLTLPGLAAFAFTLGCIRLYQRNKRSLGYLLLPIGFALVASGLELYPFWARTILWLAPILYILIGEGIVFLAEKGDKPRQATAALLVIMLLFVPSTRMLRAIPNPSTHHEFNKALDVVQEEWTAGDRILVRFSDKDALRFCLWRYDFDPTDFLVETKLTDRAENGETFIQENMTKLQDSERVWFVASYDFMNQIEPFIQQLDRHATQINASHGIGQSTFLYNFTVDHEHPSEMDARPAQENEGEELALP